MAETWLQAALDCPQTGVAVVEETFERLGALVTWTQGADDEEILEPEPGAGPAPGADLLATEIEPQPGGGRPLPSWEREKKERKGKETGERTKKRSKEKGRTRIEKCQGGICMGKPGIFPNIRTLLIITARFSFL